MSLAAHVATLGRGPGRSRSLTLAEAGEAMGAILAGRAAPEAVGAFLMLLRMKGETAAEIAGMSLAAHQSMPALPTVDLDWPSYAAGRSRGLPWFLLAARLVALAGFRVLVHGWNGRDEPVRSHLAAAGIPRVDRLSGLQRAFSEVGVAYLPLEVLSPPLYRLIGLRETLGLRSAVHTVCRMLNPARARTSVQGVFHPGYRPLQLDAACLMGWRALAIIKGGGGEFERHPAKPVRIFGLREGRRFEKTLPSLRDGHNRLAEGPAEGLDLAALWHGVRRDSFAEAVVLGTAALALDALGVPDPQDEAARLWRTRHRLLPGLPASGGCRAGTSDERIMP